MSLIPESRHTTVGAILKVYEDRADDGMRPHLGASLLGNECARALWYTFRWATRRRFDGRLLRLFLTGTLEERRFLHELRQIEGVEVHERDPDTGEQFCFSAVGGHVGGSMDACAVGLPEAPKTWHIVEFKTHNDKSFADLSKKKVAAAKPLHYAQMQCYLGWSGMERALYLACNKNTDELYGERIRFDQVTFLELMAKAERVVAATEPMEKINQDPAWYQCRFCDHHPVCHQGDLPAVSCRTCAHATPCMTRSSGVWRCEWHDKDLTIAEQKRACQEHLFIPPLVGFAEPVDAGEGWVAYQRRDTGRVFINAGAAAMPNTRLMADEVPAIYSSVEMATNSMVVGDEMVDAIKTAFDARVEA